MIVLSLFSKSPLVLSEFLTAPRARRGHINFWRRYRTINYVYGGELELILVRTFQPTAPQLETATRLQFEVLKLPHQRSFSAASTNTSRKINGNKYSFIRQVVDVGAPRPLRDQASLSLAPWCAVWWWSTYPSALDKAAQNPRRVFTAKNRKWPAQRRNLTM